MVTIIKKYNIISKYQMQMFNLYGLNYTKRRTRIYTIYIWIGFQFINRDFIKPVLKYDHSRFQLMYYGSVPDVFYYIF